MYKQRTGHFIRQVNISSVTSEMTSLPLPSLRHQPMVLEVQEKNECIYCSQPGAITAPHSQIDRRDTRASDFNCHPWEGVRIKMDELRFPPQCSLSLLA